MKLLRLLLIVIAACAANSASAQSGVRWTDLLNAGGTDLNIVDMQLEKYGTYSDGKELNTQYPSKAKGNADENMIIAFDRKKGTFTLSWTNSGEGGSDWTGTFSGAKLFLNTHKYKGKTTQLQDTWFKLLSYTKLSDGQFRVLILDEENNFRYFKAKVTSTAASFLELFL